MQEKPGVPLDNISKIIGTGTDNIIVLDNFLTESEIEEGLALSNSYAIKKDAYHAYFLFELPEYNFDDEVAHEYYERISKKMMAYARSLYPNLEIIKDKDIGIVVHPTGTHMDPHTDILDIDMTEEKYRTDTYDSQTDEFPYLWSGHLSVLAYLNDDYDGGELYFPDQDVTVKPKRGSIVTFPGNAHYIHGVKEITGGVRHTISQWCRFKDFDPRAPKA